MRFAYWITKATNTHLDYVILVNFPTNQLLPERPSMFLHSSLTNTCVSQLLSDPQSIYISSLRYRCSGKMQHVSAFCLLFVLFFLLSNWCQCFEIVYMCGWFCACVCVCIYIYCIYIYIYINCGLGRCLRQVTSVSVNTPPTQVYNNNNNNIY